MKSRHAVLICLAAILAFVSLVPTPVGAQTLRSSLMLPTTLTHASWNPDGTLLAVSGYDGIRIFDSNLQPVGSVFGGQGQWFSVEWSRDGQQLAATNNTIATTFIWSWDAQAGVAQQLRTLPNLDAFENVIGAFWNPDGSKIVTIGDYTNPAEYVGLYQVWDTATGARLNVLPYQMGFRTPRVAWSPDGSKIAGGGIQRCPSTVPEGQCLPGGAVLFVASVTDPEDIWFMPLPIEPNDIDWSDSTLAVTSLNYVETFDASTQQRLLSISTDQNYLISWSPDGRYLAAMSNSGAVDILSIGDTTYQVVASFETNAGDLPNSFEWGSSNLISITNSSGLLQVWDVSTLVETTFDEFIGAIELPDVPGSVSADTVANATVSATDPIPCATERTNTVWYRYTPGSDGWLRVSTFGSSHDTVIAAYTGTEGALTEVACNDDAPGTTASSIRFAVISETPVYIMVVNKGTTPLSGSHTLRLGYEPIYSDFIGVYNPPVAQWYLRSALSAGSPDYAPQFGFDNSQPVVCDWNGNGTDTIGVFNPANGELFLRDRNDGGGTSYPVFSYGPGGKILCGDWDGDGFDTIGVYYPDSAMFYLRNSLDAGSPDYTFQYGFDGTLPVAGDWDGDGRDGIGIYALATGNWYLRNALSSGAADYQFVFGDSYKQPITADWDGDGRDGIGVYDVSTGNWYLRNALSSGSEDYPVFAYGGFGFSVAGTWNLPGQIGVFMREGVPQIDGARSSDGAPLPPFTGDWDAIQRDNAVIPTPTPAPTSTPVPAGVFYRAINLGGRPINIDGHAWEGRNARDFTSNGQTGSNTRISLNPATDRTRTDMIQSYVEHWAHEITLANMPSGSYNVYLYAWQDWGDPSAEPFSVTLEGQTAESSIRLTGVGVWRKLGPWTVEVTDGTLNLSTSGYIPKLSGLEVWQLP